MKRAILVVLDSVGIGELPDASRYGDSGSNTLGNIAVQVKNFDLPYLRQLGLGNIEGVQGILPVEKPQGAYGRMAEQSPGKDTTTGHWEISGMILQQPFPVYPDGFPPDILESFEKEIGTKTLGNIAASGTEIIQQLGSEHMRSGYPIVYTSADSVFQIAAHEDVIPVAKLYEMCIIARRILTGKHAVGRVIARPFAGSEGDFKRTERRKDFSLDPTSKTILDYAVANGYEVRAVGKIEDIFNGRGITAAVHTKNNTEGVDCTLEYMKDSFSGLIFTNLVDFDMIYGHRNNVAGYANALMEFDRRLPEILAALTEEDMLIITADHGCDPTTPSTDHSREYVPLLVFGRRIKKGVSLGTRKTFADIGATIAHYLGFDAPLEGESFYSGISL